MRNKNSLKSTKANPCFCVDNNKSIYLAMFLDKAMYLCTRGSHQVSEFANQKHIS